MGGFHGALSAKKAGAHAVTLVQVPFLLSLTVNTTLPFTSPLLLFAPLPDLVPGRTTSSTKILVFFLNTLTNRGHVAASPTSSVPCYCTPSTLGNAPFVPQDCPPPPLVTCSDWALLLLSRLALPRLCRAPQHANRQLLHIVCQLTLRHGLVVPGRATVRLTLAFHC